MASSAASDPTILLITGYGRSGSTILDRILGQMDSVFSVGELRGVAERSLIRNRSCGCGNPFRECEVWQEVFKEAFGGFDGFDTKRYIELREKTTRTGPMLKMVLGLRNPDSPEAVEYTQMLDAIYRGIHKVTGSKVIVDSSKYPSHAYLLSSVGSLPVKTLHLVRDVRAVAHSWQRKKLKGDTAEKEYMPRLHPINSTLIWDLWNFAAQELPKRSGEPHYRLRYEDLMMRPRTSVKKLLEFAGIEGDSPFVDEHTVTLGLNHTVSGNPGRFRTGDTVLKQDDEWKTKATASTRFYASLFGAPLLLHYGYGL